MTADDSILFGGQFHTFRQQFQFEQQSG